jgi:hypothetical protein
MLGTRTPAREQSAFLSPLDEFGLQELGRLALNFGHVEMLLDHMIRLMGLSARSFAPLVSLPRAVSE